MKQALFDFSVYTIVRRDKLDKAAKTSRTEPTKPTKFPLEGKPWRTGDNLRRQAKAAGLAFPILFADAANCRHLIYWGILTKINIEGRTTHYFVKQVCPIRGIHRPQDLVLRSTGRAIAPHFIRPYAICRTPSFLV